MGDVPQYVVGYLGESGSGKSWRVAICGTQRGSSYSHSRHKVSLHNHPAKDRASVWVVPRAVGGLARGLHCARSSQGALSDGMRNKNVPGFTTYYKGLMKRSAPTLSSILG